MKAASQSGNHVPLSPPYGPINHRNRKWAFWFCVKVFISNLSVLIPIGAFVRAAPPFYHSELIFPLETWHNHASSLLELPNGDLFVVWYRGSGEHEADDVMLMGARKSEIGKPWSRPFVVADTPGLPDCNPVIFLDRRKKLWLVWSVIVAHDWRTSLLKFKISADYQHKKVPVWERADTLLFAPKNFADDVRHGFDEFLKSKPFEETAQSLLVKRLAGKKYVSRMGWIARSRPIVLSSGRILLPLYSEGLSLSLMAFSDDGGSSWSTGKPIVGLGNIQPTVVTKSDGTLVTYMRNAGPSPNRLQMSISTDYGVTWTSPRHTNLFNPGSSAEVIRMSNGYWALVYNDTEKGRYSLAISVSDNEGKSWRWTRHIERDERREGAGQFHYPSIVQTRDGLLHVSYSYFLNHLPQDTPNKTIKHAIFNLDWVQSEGARDLKTNN